MWQVLLAAAAAAGSGYFAKQLLQTTDISQQNGQNPDQIEHPQSPNTQESTKISDSGNSNSEVGILGFDQDSIFRFCCDSGSPSGSKNSKKKLGGGRKDIRGNVGKVDMKCGLVEDQRKSGRRIAVCLKKKRMTSKNASAKCEFCPSKGNSSFGWGVGMGIMYMMSAGKAEINKLNTAVGDTAKVVQELKTELAKRKSSRNLSGTSSTSQGTGTDNPRKTQSGLRFGDEGDCESSVLTEEPQQLECLEMAQLEAELESELQKLPGPTSCSCRDEEISSSYKNGVTEDFSNLDNLDLCKKDGILASELDQKLCHLLIEQQESHIVELESKLQTTNSKLSEKEAELQALKDCVKKLTEFSITNVSDEDIEAQADEEKTSELTRDDMECDSRKSAIGIKRAMDFEPYGCCTY